MPVRRDQPVTETLVELANLLNPITSGPAAPLQTGAALDSFGPSLMPRSSFHQGIAGGVAVLIARAVGLGVDAMATKVAPKTSPLAWRVGVRAALAGAGAALSRLDQTEDESTPRASARTAGRLLSLAALGGILHEAGNELSHKMTPLGAMTTGLGGFGYVMTRWSSESETRKGIVARWSDDDKQASLLASIGIATAVVEVGRGLGRGFIASRRSLVGYMGEGLGHAIIGRGLNLALWSAGAIGAYRGLGARMSRANATVEPAYASPPSNQYVSGGPNSISPYEKMGLQGRRFVSEVVPRDEIEATLGEPALADPIRAYIGVECEPIYSTRRAELALDEMERLGAFDRSYLLLVSPTGTGWVDHTVVESAEILARGDIATACIQFGKAPSFLEVQGVSLGRAQFRQLLWGVRQRLRAIDPEKRPKVLIFGESLGAWSASDVVMHQGTSGFDHYGIHRALWFGLPGLARWSKTGMREGRNPLTPPGSVMAFDRFEQYQALSPDERGKLRAVIVDHDNDPISQMSLRMAVKRPAWLDGQRGRGVPESMQWAPIITFSQVAVDAMNAIVMVPGQFKSFGHDYRADTARFVGAGFELPEITETQMASLDRTLVRRELERAERIGAGKAALSEGSMDRAASETQ
ncbi:MAG TPA: alpha/beta-hydrolase family protein [Acidimicrobiia bacterium]|nr:alpha/beta-hydrolase family protein [Acidimicrobiia bacterium]